MVSMVVGKTSKRVLGPRFHIVHNIIVPLALTQGQNKTILFLMT